MLSLEDAMTPAPALHTLLVIILAPCLGCGLGGHDETDLFFQEPPGSLDLLFVMDDSASMAQEREAIGRALPDLTAHLDGVDLQVGVISTNLDNDHAEAAQLLGEPPWLTHDELDALPERFEIEVDGGSRSQGLDAALVALDEATHPEANTGFRRAEASLGIVFFTTTDDCSDRGALGGGADGFDCLLRTDLLVPVTELAREYRGLVEDPRELTTSALVDLDDADEGDRYPDLVAHVGGVTGDIGDYDPSDDMYRIGAVLGGRRLAFRLDRLPVLDTLEVWVNELEGEASDAVLTEGWSFDLTRCQLRFDEADAPPLGSVVSVLYESSGTPCD